MLARRFAQIGETDREVIDRLRRGMPGAPTWAVLVRQIGDNLRAEEGASIAILAGWAGEPELLEHLVRLASHSDDRIALAVEQSIERLVEKSASMPPHAVASISAALAAAVDSFGEHRRRGILRAAVGIWGTPAGLWHLEHTGANAAWWTDDAHPAHLGLRSLIRRDGSPEMTRAALAWLRAPTLAPACRDRLWSIGTPADRERLLTLSHLLYHPARRREIERLNPNAERSRTTVPATNPARARPRHESGLGSLSRPEALARLDSTSRRFAPRWIGLLAASSQSQQAALGSLVADPCRATRHAAVRAACAAGDTETISDFCYDDDACTAVSASVARLCLRPPVGAGVVSEHVSDEVAAWTRLARSTHAGVRRISQAALDRYAGVNTAAATHTLILRRRARRGKADVIAELKGKINGGDEGESISAIRSAVRLGCIEDVKVELLRALWREPGSHTTDDGRRIVTDAAAPCRVAASAASALAEADDEATADSLRACLGHADIRVRSNAIESLGKRWRRAGLGSLSGTRSGTMWVGSVPSAAGWRTLFEFKDDEHHRLRATAGWVMFAGALLRGDASSDAWRDEAQDLALCMLRDDRSAHVLAGLWLSERLAAHSDQDVRSRIGQAALDLVSHPDSPVGERALRCVERSGLWDQADELHDARDPAPRRVLTEAA